MSTKYLLEQPICQKDLDRVRKSGIKDVCFTANVLAAHALNLLEADSSIDTLEVPKICANCLTELVNYAILKECSRTVELVEVDFRVPGVQGGNASESAPTSVCSTVPSANLSKDATAGAPQMGIIGNPLLVFDSFMNENIAQLLAELGLRVVWPDASLIYAEDISYKDQLQKFNAEGVRDVIYLQSFLCLKGHVASRGALHSLRREFAGMDITVIDYDPESSALNRENRIRLAVEQARSKPLR